MKTTCRILVPVSAFVLTGLTLIAAQDRVTIPLTDPSQPVTLTASVMNGGITVKAASVKDVVVEARVRTRQADGEVEGRHRIPINTTGLTAEEENNQVEIGVESVGRTVDLEITVPIRTS